MKITVWTMTIDHRHGIDTTVHATEADAMQQLRAQFEGDELWFLDGATMASTTVNADLSDDLLHEYLTNGYNEVSFYGPDPVVLDVPDPKVEIIHSRDPDSECHFSYFVNGQPLRNVEGITVEEYTLDAGAGYDFASWAGQAASAKQAASPEVWAELESHYADPGGDEYLEDMPENTDWLDHLDDTPDNRAWWTANHPGVPLDYLF